MKEYKYKSTRGNGIEYLIKNAYENKRKWILEVFFDNKKYPNIITGRYKTLKEAKDNMGNYNTNGELLSYGEY